MGTRPDSNKTNYIAGDVTEADQTLDLARTVDHSAPGEDTASVAAVGVNSAFPSTIGRYDVQGVLGSGAYGAVYRGYDNQLGRDVAIKTPLSMRAEVDESVVESFMQEARQLAQLTHPNIVTVFDVGIDDPTGLCYIVSDFLDGQDLNDWLQDRTPSWQETVRIVAAAADGLAAAHARSTVHRDVKPANILMVERAEGVTPVLVDFGLALSESTAAQAEAQRGKIAGTPNYMSPEQARGEGHRIDGRTDIYALGVILYVMLSGELPFRSKSVSNVLRQVIEDEPRPPRQIVHGIPRELERICLHAMAKQMSDRYTTAGDLAQDLRDVLRNHEAEVQAARAAVKAKDTSSTREATKILVAEDHELSRFKLTTDLKKWGHDLTIAEDGQQAWEMFQQDEFSIVITDWMMPEMDGLELVRRIRATERSEYVYIIMLTAKAEKHDIVTGMGAGADDFLAKPFHRDELQVRLRAGIRITDLNHELNETNRRLRRDQEAAAEIQRSFLPTSKPAVAGYDFAWDHRSRVDLGGDMLNIVPLDDKHLGLFMLDVSGEEVSAALLATSLSRVMSPASDPASVLVERDGDDVVRVLKPIEVAARLNQQFSGETKNYFTMAYGVLNAESREFCYTSAGHPPILHQRADGSHVMLDISGFPIGMAPEDEQFVEQSVTLQPHDRLLIYSDGLPDAMSQGGEVFGAARLLEASTKLRDQSLDDMAKLLMKAVDQWIEGAESTEDASLMAIEVG